MVRRKDRIPVVMDTNVFIRSFKSRSKQSPNKIVVKLWFTERRLQLIVSDPVLDEYMGIFQNVILMSEAVIEEWRHRFKTDSRSTLVSLGRRYLASRDPDDNLMLATAAAGEAKYLITNDRDLLDLSAEFKKTVRFKIVTPAQLVKELRQSD